MKIKFNRRSYKPNLKTSKRLIDECKIMQTRIQAILDCNVAIEFLEHEDVFGNEYRNFLRTDVHSLAKTIALSEKEMKKMVSHKGRIYVNESSRSL